MCFALAKKAKTQKNLLSSVKETKILRKSRCTIGQKLIRETEMKLLKFLALLDKVLIRKTSYMR